MITINFISGLGADERVFQYLDIPGVEKKNISWIDPLNKETIEHYASRLSAQIDKEKNNILLCVSFGGLAGIELSKTVHFEKIIIISSVKNKYEVPFYFRIAGLLRVDKIIPAFAYKSSTPLLTILFGINCKNERTLLRAIIKDTGSVFLKWAIGQVLRWRNVDPVNNLYHIHGTSDRLLPVCFIGECIQVKNGHHFMIVSRADEIGGKINKILAGEY